MFRKLNKIQFLLSCDVGVTVNCLEIKWIVSSCFNAHLLSTKFDKNLLCNYEDETCMHADIQTEIHEVFSMFSLYVLCADNS
jgi:hypothetical protein